MHRLYDFVFVVESRRATTLRIIRSLRLSLFEIDFRMVIFGVWKINDCVCCVGANNYSPLQILRLYEIKYFKYIFSFSLLIINETFLYLTDLSQN